MSLIYVVEWYGVGKMNASNVIDRQTDRQADLINKYIGK